MSAPVWVLLIAASWAGGAVLAAAVACRCSQCLAPHLRPPAVVDLQPTDLPRTPSAVHVSDIRLDPATTAALLRSLLAEHRRESSRG